MSSFIAQSLRHLAISLILTCPFIAQDIASLTKDFFGIDLRKTSHDPRKPEHRPIFAPVQQPREAPTIPDALAPALPLKPNRKGFTFKVQAAERGVTVSRQDTRKLRVGGSAGQPYTRDPAVRKTKKIKTDRKRMVPLDEVAENELTSELCLMGLY